MVIDSLGESYDVNKSDIQLGSLSNFVGHHSKRDEKIIVTKMKKSVEIMPKPRTALFQEGENDEPMTHQVVVSRLAEESGTITNSFMKFCSFLVDVNASVIPYNNLFIGANVKLHPCSGVFGQ